MPYLDPLTPEQRAALNKALPKIKARFEQWYRNAFNQIVSVDVNETSENTAASGLSFGIAYAARELKEFDAAIGGREEITPGPKLDADDLQALVDFIAEVAKQAKADEAKATEFLDVNLDELLEGIEG